MSNTSKKFKWHKRHVTIDTPCKMSELDGIINAIASSGGWADAQVNVDEDRIVITFGDEPDDENEKGKMQIINE